MNNKIFGFSLVEMSVVMTIIAIITSLALPSYHRYMASQEAKQVPQTLTLHIQKAKQESLLYRQNIILCATSTFDECNSDWSNGYMLFIDQNKNRSYDRDEQILSSMTMPLKYGALTWRGAGTNQRMRSSMLVFEGSVGLPIASNGTFRYCSSYNHHQNLVLSRMGQSRVEQPNAC
ncbi:GspH/FimT family pseudopilin [Acinetobacter ihumii]|uniref:GspH/FimT family pseudopilin n=1 Tax=Acinetobacter ihumii TaxID=2483802 RepID=UPI001030903C|nr:GspH/FimT family pseudopilin [Acinetobacter ihumii]